MVLLQRRRSDRIIIPRSRPDNAYGDKPPVQIEREIREKQRQEREAYARNNPSPPARPITPLDYIDEEPIQPMETEPTEPVDLVERGRDYLQFNFPNFQNRVRE